jgi:hypothetical protein
LGINHSRRGKKGGRKYVPEHEHRHGEAGMEDELLQEVDDGLGRKWEKVRRGCAKEICNFH